MEVRKDLGAATAYAMAVRGGYTGTQEEYEALLASYGTVAAEAEQHKEDAEAYAVGKRDGTDVGSSDTAYQNNAKYYAGEAADVLAGANQAKADALTAKDGAVSAKNDAVQAKTDAISAKDAAVQAKTDAIAAKDAAVQAKTDAQSVVSTVQAAQTAAETAQGKAETAQGKAEDAQEAAETAQGKAEDAQEAAEAVLESIPQDYSELSDDVSALLSQIKATEIVVQSESKPIVQIADGSANNAKSYDVQIAPVQDLHGYDNPWPAGGGVNKLNVELPIVLSAAGNTGEKACVLPAGTYTFTSKTSVEAAYTFSVYNSSNTQLVSVSSATASASNLSVTFTLEEASAYIKCYYNTACSITNMQIESGSSFSGYSPYSNICPISGWTGAKAVVAGKNLVDKEDGHTSNSNWWIGSSISTQVPDGSFVLSPGTYTLSVSEPQNGLYVNAGEARDLAFAYNKAALTFTLTEKKPIRILLYKDGITSAYWDTLDIQLELGDTATPYEPYSGSDYSITFPQSAGAVYGGSLHVNEDGSGTLTVDMSVVDMGSLDWAYTTPTGTPPVFYANLKDLGASYDSPSNGICSKYPLTATAQYASDKTARLYSSVEYDFVRIGVRDDSYTTDSDFEASVTGEQLGFPLTSPQTYTLTAPQIALLLGENNLWSDTGDMAVEYIADTKLYIQTLTGHPDEDMIADSNIPSGNFFMVGNRLFISTSAIASGETIVPGTNCTETNLAAALNTINAD